jgi:hypothetical protein
MAHEVVLLGRRWMGGAAQASRGIGCSVLLRGKKSMGVHDRRQQGVYIERKGYERGCASRVRARRVVLRDQMS